MPDHFFFHFSTFFSTFFPLFPPHLFFFLPLQKKFFFYFFSNFFPTLLWSKINFFLLFSTFTKRCRTVHFLVTFFFQFSPQTVSVIPSWIFKRNQNGLCRCARYVELSRNKGSICILNAILGFKQPKRFLEKLTKKLTSN